MRLKEFEIWLDEKKRPYLHEKETAVFDNGEAFRHPRQIYELAEKLGLTKHAYESSYVLYTALNMKVLGILKSAGEELLLQLFLFGKYFR